MLPIALRPDGRRAVIVGGGGVALRKAESLVAAGFPVFVVAPVIDGRLSDLLARRGGECAERAYESSDVAGAGLVVAATGDDAVNARVVEDARAAGILVCDATDGERGNCTMPAAARIGELTIAVDTGGAAPAFSKRVLEEIGATLDADYGRALETLARMRTYAKTALSPQQRRAALIALSAMPIAELAAMNPAQAEHEVEAAVARLRGDTTRATSTLRCASRASALAMTQTRWVASKLAERGVATTILPVTTAGDRDRERPIESLGVNVFVKELEIALRERRADYAVHSCKDLPSQLPADMTIAAISARQDPRDGFCSERYERFADLPPGAIVGTSSPRRRAALALLRPDLDYREMRGNVDTRLRKLQEGRYDAIVLAMAGLKRLGAGATHTVAFSVEDVVPAVGQGALAIETLANDAPIARTLRDAVNDVTAELCIGCERAALRALRAGCSVPLGVHASLDGDIMTVRGFFGGADAEPRRALLRDAVRSMREADSLGSRLADALRSPLSGRLVVVPRTQARPSRVAGALRELGAEVVELRAGDAWPDPAERMPDMLLFASSGAVAAAEPYLRGLRALTRKPIVAAIGPRTSAAAAGAGFAPDAEASAPSVEALVELARKRLERA